MPVNDDFLLLLGRRGVDVGFFFIGVMSSPWLLSDDWLPLVTRVDLSTPELSSSLVSTVLPG